MKKRKVIVTGANGLIGFAICTLLLSKSFIVHGLYHKNKDHLKPLRNNKNFHSHKADFTDYKNTNDLLGKIKPHSVFHTAASLHHDKPNNPTPFFENNALGTLNILEACKQNKVSTFIHSSSISVYGNIDTKRLPAKESYPKNPQDHYALSKSLAEDICNYYTKTTNINIIILRYSGVFGSRRKTGAVANFFKNAIENKPLKIDTNINWDIIDSEDAAIANYKSYLKAKEIKHKTINIGRGKEISIFDLAKEIISINKSKSKIVIYDKIKIDPHRLCLDIREARNTLDFKPTSLKKSLQKYYNTIKNDSHHSST